jgi:hypothetical protein
MQKGRNLRGFRPFSFGMLFEPLIDIFWGLYLMDISRPMYLNGAARAQHGIAF